MPSLSEILGGSNPQISQTPRLGPENQQLVNQLIGSLGGQIGTGSSFAPIAAQARENFQNKTAPTIRQMFSNMGGLSSSGYQNALAEAGAGLESSLAAQQAQFGQAQRGQDLQGLLSLLQIGAPQLYQSQPGRAGLLETVGPAAIQYGIQNLQNRNMKDGEQGEGVDLLSTLGNAGLNVGTAYATGGVPGASLATLGELFKLFQAYKKQNQLGQQAPVQQSSNGLANTPYDQNLASNLGIG